MTWHDLTWHDMTWFDLTWLDLTWPQSASHTTHQVALHCRLGRCIVGMWCATQLHREDIMEVGLIAHRIPEWCQWFWLMVRKKKKRCSEDCLAQFQYSRISYKNRKYFDTIEFAWLKKIILLLVLPREWCCFLTILYNRLLVAFSDQFRPQDLSKRTHCSLQMLPKWVLPVSAAFLFVVTVGTVRTDPSWTVKSL